MNLSGDLKLENTFYKDIGQIVQGETRQVLHFIDTKRNLALRSVSETRTQGSGLFFYITFELLDKDLNRIGIWELGNDYGAQYVGTTDIYYDSNTTRIFGILEVSDSLTGKTTANGFSIQFVEYIIDYNDFNNSYVELISDLGFSSASNTSRLILKEVNIYDKYLIYSRAGNTWKYDYVNDIELNQFSANISWSDNAIPNTTKKTYSIEEDYTINFTANLSGSTYSQYLIKQELSTGNILHQSSNPFLANLIGTKLEMINDNLFKIWFCPRPSGVYGSEYEIRRIYYGLVDKDLNFLKLYRSDVNTQSYSSDLSDFQMIFDENKELYVHARYVRKLDLIQSTNITPILSGATSSNEQVDTSIPIRQSWSHEVFRISADNVVSYEGRIERMQDLARGNNVIQTDYEKQVELIESDAQFGGARSINFNNNILNKTYNMNVFISSPKIGFLMTRRKASAIFRNNFLSGPDNIFIDTGNNYRLNPSAITGISLNVSYNNLGSQIEQSNIIYFQLDCIDLNYFLAYNGGIYPGSTQPLGSNMTLNYTDFARNNDGHKMTDMIIYDFKGKSQSEINSIVNADANIISTKTGLPWTNLT